METTDKPLSFGSQERKLRPRGGKRLRSLCKSGPKLGLEPDPGGPAWRPGPAWEAAHWVCQGLRPAPLGAAQEGPSAFSVSPPPPPCLTPVWITFSPVPSQALLEVGLPPLLVPGNPGALCGSPGLAGPTQTVVKQWLSGQRKACLPRAGPRQRLQLPPHANGPSY